VSLAPSRLMTRTLKRWLLLAVGWAFIILGVAGLFLPFLQGILMLLIGLSILSTEYAWAHNLQQKLGARFPGLGSRFNEAKVWVATFLRRIASLGSDKAQS